MNPNIQQPHSVSPVPSEDAKTARPDLVTADFPIIRMGFGKVEAADATWEGLPALWFGNDGQGLGVQRERNEPAKDRETLVLFTFANLAGLEAIEAAVARARKMLEAAQ